MGIRTCRWIKLYKDEALLLSFIQAVSSSQDAQEYYTEGTTGAYSTFKRLRLKPPCAQRPQHKGGACQCFPDF